MNNFFLVLTTASYIPWCIMLIIYLINYNIFHFLSTCIYLVFAGMKWSHRMHGNMSVIFWSRIYLITEMCLFLRLIILNIIHSGIASFTIMLTMWIFMYKLKTPLQKTVTEAPVYCVCLLFLMSSSRLYIQHVASVILITISIYLWKEKYQFETENDMWQKLYIHYSVKVLETYMVFLLEWASSGMTFSSLVILFLFPLLYSLLGYYSVENNKDDLSEYRYKLCKLPDRYPLPLNFKYAIASCNVAKKVFKDHTI